MNKIIQKTITHLFIDKACMMLDQPHSHYKGLKLIARSPEECVQRDFESLAAMTDINTCSLKRFISLSANFNDQNKQKLLYFMEYAHWDALIIEAVKVFLSKN